MTQCKHRTNNDVFLRGQEILVPLQRGPVHRKQCRYLYRVQCRLVRPHPSGGKCTAPLWPVPLPLLRRRVCLATPYITWVDGMCVVARVPIRVTIKGRRTRHTEREGDCTCVTIIVLTQCTTSLSFVLGQDPSDAGGSRD